MKQNITELFRFIEASPTCYHAIQSMRGMLDENGFAFLDEKEAWELVPGKRYYAVRGGSSLIAFCIPEEKAESFRIIASHSDSPAFRLKPNAETQRYSAYTLLNTEPYGGGIFHTWMDRPLSVAGRVIVQGKAGLESRLVKIDRDLLVIPSLAIHMNRDVNKKLELNAQNDLLPLVGGMDAKGRLAELAADCAGCKKEDILGEDLFLYNRMKPVLAGASEEYICSPRLDDLECVFGSLQGFLKAAEESRTQKHISLCCVFDNEEVGSATRQGAASTFLSDVLERICIGLRYGREDYHRMIAGSFLVSADNAHALHPAAEAKADPVNRPLMNKGLVLKYSASQKYTTDGASAAVFKAVCRKAGIPVQDFSNRSDIPGGSTLGNISSTKVPVLSADIGLAQLAMHSACETAGTEDMAYLIAFSTHYYNGF